MKKALILCGVLLATTALTACSTLTQIKDATPEQKIEWACFATSGAIRTFATLQPVYLKEITQTEVAVYESAKALVAAACTKPLDPRDTNAVIERLFDFAGQVAAIIAKLHSPDPGP